MLLSPDLRSLIMCIKCLRWGLIFWLFVESYIAFRFSLFFFFFFFMTYC